MKIVCIGDSLTEGDYGVYGKTGIANVHSENYPYFLSKSLSADVVNYGVCGFTPVDSLGFYERGGMSELCEADVIIIMLGTNGGLSSVEETKHTKAYRDIISFCNKEAPDARVAVCTPPHVTENPEYSNCGYKDRVDEAVKFVRRTASELNLPLIDVAECPSFNAENEHIMQPNDGLHFGKEGYRTMAKFIEEKLRLLFPELF